MAKEKHMKITDQTEEVAEVAEVAEVTQRSALVFPRLVFISPGKQQLAHGKTYDYSLVVDEAEYDDAIASGFSATVPEAIAAAEEK